MSYTIFKTLLIVFSAIATVLSLIFMLSPRLFRSIEEFLGLEFNSRIYVTVLEGKVDFINDWIHRNHSIFGPLFAVLAALNMRNAFFF